MKLSDYVAQFLASQGVKHIFTLPGGFSMHLNDSLHHHGAMTPVYCLHEAGADIAAEAYGKIAPLAVCVVTAGPGATNAITPCASSYCDSVPVLYISGQVKRDDLSLGYVRCSGPQEVPITEMVRMVTKFSWLLDRPQDVAYILEKAVYIATHGRKGPVWIDIPLDVQAAQIDPEELEHFKPVDEPTQEHQAHRIIPLLKLSKRPLLLFGAGALGARDDVAKLVDLLGVPVLTTWMAKDLFGHDDPLLIGSPGPTATRAANWALQTCDLLICIGARIDSVMTLWQPEHFAPHAQIVMVDIDEAELDWSDVADMKINMDAGQFMRELRNEFAAIKALDLDSYFDFWCHLADWTARCRDWKARYPITGDTPTYQLTNELSDLLTPDDIIVVSAASVAATPIFHLAFKQKLGQRIYYSNGLDSMGFDIPYAIGACLASGRNRTICITGDGSFMQNCQELEVIHRLNLPIKIFVVDNHGYSGIRNSQLTHMKRLSGADEASGLTIPSIIDIGNAFGIGSFAIDRYMDAMILSSVPTIFVLDCPPDERAEPRVMSHIGDDGQMVSGTLENMYPYLTTDELIAEVGA